STGCSPSQARGGLAPAAMGPSATTATPPGTLAALGKAACVSEGSSRGSNHRRHRAALIIVPATPYAANGIR
ncbi:MAG TPA: hypothetical protein PKJ92_15525, partial [Accumulibacter sp.]|nr:hypothetical protein [Accumulibacter sp.]